MSLGILCGWVAPCIFSAPCVLALWAPPPPALQNHVALESRMLPADQSLGLVAGPGCLEGAAALLPMEPHLLWCLHLLFTSTPFPLGVGSPQLLPAAPFLLPQMKAPFPRR